MTEIKLIQQEVSQQISDYRVSQTLFQAQKIEGYTFPMTTLSTITTQVDEVKEAFNALIRDYAVMLERDLTALEKTKDSMVDMDRNVLPNSDGMGM
ncbi:YwqI/YxiC family protein [Listeria booriae]|uniref:DUF5344 family protein n=1 Tax=Listeria booriae TaxID=1552123 RepID=UPI0016272C02|nr:DUF5344 family protein [Listeria booriae]MBC1230408.1 YwqI/YxiC family protein [Listeria booriae]MBC1273803.1 YwqI/YxiC family protein [Listeria booriae]